MHNWPLCFMNFVYNLAMYTKSNQPNKKKHLKLYSFSNCFVFQECTKMVPIFQDISLDPHQWKGVNTPPTLTLFTQRGIVVTYGVCRSVLLSVFLSMFVRAIAPKLLMTTASYFQDMLTLIILTLQFTDSM